MIQRGFIHIILTGAVALGGCDSNRAQTEVPEAVQKNFVKMYPTADAVEWEREQDRYRVEFEISSWERNALFGAAGNLIRYGEEISERYLPAAAQEHIQSHWASHRIEEVYRVKQGQTTFYEVELAHQQAETRILFDAHGQLLEQHEATETVQANPQQASYTETGAGHPASLPALPAPSARWELPAALREVSGIALLDNGLMACVQDEEGVVFLYDLDKKAIVRKINFAEKGDYEGIALAGNTAYVLRSDGEIFEISSLQTDKPRVQRHASVLAKTLDAEGLAYDKANNRLLIAPKGYDERLGNHKGIYAFSLADKKMQEKPVITISLTQEKLQEAGKERKSNDEVLQPSSLEINEQTGVLYLLDAKNYRLLTVDEQGQIQKIIPLDKELLRQPEGFAFSRQGELYLSSEGSKRQKGVILKFADGF